MSVARAHADAWRDALRTAGQINPDHLADRITASADTGLRATRYDAIGGRTTRMPCQEHETCEDGPEEHSHRVTSDPTGNAAARGLRADQAASDLAQLKRARTDFVLAAGVVLDWVCGKRPVTWGEVLRVNASLMPGTVQAGLDVDHARHLPRAIDRAAAAVRSVVAIAGDHQPRTPTQDEQHWTAGLADEDCCAWHLAIHRRYRRPKVGAFRGERICSDCMQLVLLGESRPPAWLLEAEVDRLGKPRVWQQALARWMDELGISQERSA